METLANSNQTIWMGLGIFERLYSEKKIEQYFEALDKLPNPKIFLLADEITGTNNFVLSGRKFDLNDVEALKNYKQKAHEKFSPKYEFIQELIKKSSNSDLWKVEYWNFLSESPEYQILLKQLHEEIIKIENHHLRKEVIKVTIFGFGARLRKNFTSSFVEFVFDKDFYRYLETLSEYTIEEIAAIFYFAKKGFIKAGHDEEKPYDELSIEFYKSLNNEVLKMPEPPRFYYL